MSKIRTSFVLPDSSVQFDTTATNPGLQQREVFVPLTSDGVAVRTAAQAATSVTSSTTAFASATPSSTYQFSSAIDMSMYNVASVEYLITVAESGKTTNFKAQWSNDGSNYFNEPLGVNGASGGSEASNNLEYSINLAARVVNVGMDTTRRDGEQISRKAKYLRFALKSDATSGKASVIVTPINN